MHLDRLGDTSTAEEGCHCPRPCLPTNSDIRDVYAGPTDAPLPGLGTMSSRIALRREPLARLMSVSLGSSRSSTVRGILLLGTPRNAAIPTRSASSQLSISRTATRKHMCSAGAESHSVRSDGAHSKSLSRSTRTIQGENLAARLYPSIMAFRWDLPFLPNTLPTDSPTSSASLRKTTSSRVPSTAPETATLDSPEVKGLRTSPTARNSQDACRECTASAMLRPASSSRRI